MVLCAKVFSLPFIVSRSLCHSNFKSFNHQIMKAQKINCLGAISKITLLAVLLIIASCKTKEGSIQGESTSKKAEVKPPQVDIHTAVLNENMEAIKQHIAAGSDINAKDPFGGSSPLITAALFGKTEMAKVLIEAGADVNFQNNDESTALHIAAFFCRPDVVKLLLENGADKTIKNKYGQTPYEMVAGPFSEMKPAYDMMVQVLGPMGLKLDYAYVEKTRPQIAATLK
jgi:ankyrin repeat protein